MKLIKRPGCPTDTAPETNRKGLNDLDHSTINRATAYRRPAWISAALVLGIMAGSLFVASTTPAASAAPDGPEQVYALSTGDELLSFDGDEPGDATSKDITGLRTGESLVGIDFRPTNSTTAAPNTQGKLYAIGDQGFVYTINPDTAAATRGARLTVGTTGTPVVLTGESFGMDFNPDVDRLRLVSDANQNLRINVDNGQTTVDTPLQYAVGDPNAGTDPEVGSVAYRDSQASGFGTATPTEIYDIDAATDDMSEQTPPNDGTLVTEGPLDRMVRVRQGFDIVTIGSSPAGDRGFAVLKPMVSGRATGFYTVNLEDGSTVRIGRIGSGDSIQVEGLAIPISQR